MLAYVSLRPLRFLSLYSYLAKNCLWKVIYQQGNGTKFNEIVLTSEMLWPNNFECLALFLILPVLEGF